MTNTQAQAQKWIDILLAQDLPFIDPLSEQIAAGKIGELCKCGCQGFAFDVYTGVTIRPLQDGAGLLYALAFASNFSEEIDMLLFTDERGFLSRVDVTYGADNIGPLPEGLIPGAKIGAWPSACDCSSNRVLWRSVARTARPMVVGHRALLGVATRLSQTVHTTSATSRHPPGVSLTCLLAHLLAVCRTVLSGALNAESARPR